MHIVLLIVLYIATACWQFNRSLRWGKYPRRAILDAVVAAVLIPFSWFIWFFRRPYYK
jgi:hypothetical protein